MNNRRTIFPDLCLLGLILVAYLALGSAYVLNTPLWQAPDEPAHFNYVRDLAEGRGFPVLQMGDYDQQYLERIMAAHFPPEMSIDRIRYESHQPPLYYLLEVPIYRALEGRPLAQQVVSLRIFSLLLGALLLTAVYRAVRRILPGEQTLAVGVTALVAFIPQHLHVTGSINNDILGELFLTVVLLLLLARMQPAARQLFVQGPHPFAALRAGSNPLPKGEGTSSVSTAFLHMPSPAWGGGLTLGVALGLALLVKDTAYVAVPLIPLGLALGDLLTGRVRWARLALATAGVYAVALAISGWWFLRNMSVYGGLDIFGLARHGQVVVGQPRVGVFDGAAAGRFVTVGFQSFWAQFGWMGVPSDSRTYAVAGALTLLAAAGLVIFLAREARVPSLSPYQRASLTLLAVAFLLVLAGVVHYNLEFIQPQGRYFYPALLPTSLFAYLGLRQFMGRRPVLPTALLSLSLFILAAYNLWRVLIPGLR